MAVLSVETKKVSELDAASAVAASDNFIVDTALSGTQKATFGAVVDSLKSALNVPASANTLLSNESISTTYENVGTKVAASSTVNAIEVRTTNAERDMMFLQGAYTRNNSLLLSSLLTAIRSNDPRAYCLGDYITASNKVWVVVAKNYYTAYNFTTYKQHAVLMMYDATEEKVYNTGNTNAGGYNGSELRTWLEGTFYNSLPSDLRACILPVTVSESTMGGLSQFTRSIQLPSVMQLTGTAQDAETHRAFGPPLPIVHNAGFLRGGSAADYWTSTPVDGSTTNFAVYAANYQFATYGQARYGRAVRPLIVIG